MTPDERALILDTETTGKVEPKPLEIAWLRVEAPSRLRVIEEFCGRFNPGKPSELGALAIHHILDREVVDCPPWTEFQLPGTDYLIGHRIDYDWQVIGCPPVKRICTHALATALWPSADTHSQSALLYLLEGEAARDRLKAAHSAAADVVNCRTVLAHIVAALPGTWELTWEALWQRSEAARVPAVMPFGKHRGMPMADVPVDYKRWLLGQPDVDPYLRTALAGAP